MKAVRIYQHGGAEQLRYERAPDPSLRASGDVIVKLAAAALNEADIRTRRGLGSAPLSFPHILGADGAGVVVETGPDVKHLRPGDRVCLYPASACGACANCIDGQDHMCPDLALLGERSAGTYAEYIAVPGRDCFALPLALDFEQGAALPFAYLSAWRMLISRVRIRPGERVLVLGVGGIGSNVATAALQLAVAAGARVIATGATDEALEKSKSLGAEHGIDDARDDFVAGVRALTGKRGVDVVIDCIGGDTWIKSLAAMAKGGRLAICGAAGGVGAQTDVRRIFWNHLKIYGSTLGSREEFQQLLNFLDASQTKPTIDTVFPLSEAGMAHRRVEEGKSFGKVVLRMQG